MLCLRLLLSQALTLLPDCLMVVAQHYERLQLPKAISFLNGKNFARPPEGDFQERMRRAWGNERLFQCNWNLCARGVFQRDVRAQHLFACCTSVNARPSMLAEPRSWAGLLAEEEEGKMVPSCCVSWYMAFLPARAESMKVITTLAFAW